MERKDYFPIPLREMSSGFLVRGEVCLNGVAPKLIDQLSCRATSRLSLRDVVFSVSVFSSCGEQQRGRSGVTNNMEDIT